MLYKTQKKKKKENYEIFFQINQNTSKKNDVIEYIENDVINNKIKSKLDG